MGPKEPRNGVGQRGPRAGRVAVTAFAIGALFDLVVFLVNLVARPYDPTGFIASPTSAVAFAFLPFLCALSAVLALAVARKGAPGKQDSHPMVLREVTSSAPSLEAEPGGGAAHHPFPTSEEVRRLAEIAAREIKHPLTSIVGYSLTLKHYWDKLSEEERRKFVDFIHLSSIRLEGMVNDLARIMELSRDRKKREGEVIDLEETAEEVAQILSEVHRGRKVTLNLRFPREKLRVKGDPVGLFDLLYNLFDLGMRASAERSVVSAWFNLLDGKVVLRLRCPRVQFPPSRIEDIEKWAPEVDSDDLATLGMQYRLSHLMVREMGGRLSLGPLGENGMSVQAQLPAFVPHRE